MNVEWDDISFLISSRYRIEVVRRLDEGPSTPSKIANEGGISIAHISRALRQLRARSMVELLVSEDRKKGRVYGITEKGRAIWQRSQQENLV